MYTHILYHVQTVGLQYQEILGGLTHRPIIMSIIFGMTVSEKFDSPPSATYRCKGTKYCRHAT